MELMIDTWNVLHQTGILPPESAGIGTRGLYALIEGSRWGGETVTLVCDGTSSENAMTGPNVQTIFTGPHRSADDEIMARVANSTAARSILVITSDREIIRSIKTNGAQQLGSAAFLQTLVDDCATPKKQSVHRPSGLSKERANEWRKAFGIDDQAIQDLHNTPIPELKDERELRPTPAPEKVEPPKDKKTRSIQSDAPLLPDALLEEARRLIAPD
jgi:predicted RNA-binding protein with PIN domain